MKKIKPKVWLRYLVIVLLSFNVTLLLYSLTTAPKSNQRDELIEVKEEPKQQAEPPKEVVLPDAYQIVVPYTVQAPNASWDVHEESCEEAALLMYHYFLAGSTFSPKNIIPVATADAELRKMKTWQVTNWGSEPDLTLTKLGEFATSYYGYSFKVTKVVTEKEIKEAIAAGNPVMVPVITHGLANPHYGRQPSYHILLIKGYDATGVITNDAGVKEGQNWHYTWQILWQAVDQQKLQGRDMLVLTKN